MKNINRLSQAQLDAILTVQNDGVLFFNPKLQVDKVNQAFINNYEFDPTGLTFEEVIRRAPWHWEDGRPFRPEDQPTQRALRGENVTGARFVIKKNDGKEVVVEISSGPVRIGDKIVGAVTVWHPITELKRVEQALLDYKERLEEARRESEERFRVLAEVVPQLVWMTDADGNFKYLNNQIYYYTGVKTEELIKSNWDGVFHPDDVEKRYANWREAIRTGKPYQIEYRIRRFDGEYRWFLGRGLPLRNNEGEIINWFGTCTDIHYQKQLEMELHETNSRLQRLNKQMVTKMEEERSMLARELHDEAGQALTALKIFIELIFKGLTAESNELRQRISEAVQLTDRTLETIRRLAHDLHPPALDALGLNLALEDFCHEFGQRVGLKIKYRGCDLPVITSTVSISLYRFLQEALTNVVKHAQADSVYVRLAHQGQQTILVVKDNGTGFEPYLVGLKGKGMGLAGMQERLAMQGGKLSIHSKPGKGTRLVATVPLEVVS